MEDRAEEARARRGARARAASARPSPSARARERTASGANVMLSELQRWARAARHRSSGMRARSPQTSPGPIHRRNLRWLGQVGALDVRQEKRGWGRLAGRQRPPVFLLLRLLSMPHRPRRVRVSSPRRSALRAPVAWSIWPCKASIWLARARARRVDASRRGGARSRRRGLTRHPCSVAAYGHRPGRAHEAEDGFGPGLVESLAQRRLQLIVPESARVPQWLYE